MSSTVYHFETFEVRLDSRQLLGPSGPVELQPRTLDLLVFLIANRNRVVSKDELLIEVWKTAHISESVLARAVMKLRRALEQVGSDPDVVKTIHRVGYRFTAEPAEPPRDVQVAARSQNVRIALLPFVNETGDQMLAWVELGLLTLVCRSLDNTAGVSVVSIESMLASLKVGADPEEQVASLRSALGIAQVARVVIRADPTGEFRLQWRLWGSDDVAARGEIAGHQLTDLAAELAAALAKKLLTGHEVRPSSFSFSDNDFLTAAHARALQAFAVTDRTRALALIQVCLDLDPHPLQIEVDFIRILTVTEPARAATLGEKLLLEIDPVSHPIERAALLTGLADAAMFARNWDKCEVYADQAEALLGDDQVEEHRDRLSELRFEIALERGEINQARYIGRSRIAHAREVEDMFTLSGNLANLGKLELAKGDWEVGRRLMTEAIALARKFETRTLGTALNNLALTSMWRGLLPESIELLTESVEACKAEKYPTGVAHALMNLYAASSDVGESEKAIRYIEEARELIPSSGGGLLSLDGYLVDAQIRFGSVDAAYAQSVDALRRLKDVSGLHRTFGLYVLGLIAHGSLDEADAHLKNADERYAEPTSTLAHFNYLAAYAHLAYRRKDAQKAQQYLERYIAARGSLVSAYDGGTNFLWIKLDLDLIDDARDIAMQIPDHMKHTLRGQLCAARIAYEERSFDEAIRLQRAVNQLSAGRRMRGYLEKLLLHYEQTMASGRYKKIPRSELLPSLI